MASLYIMQTGQTTWEAQSRVEPLAGSPLTPAGAEAAAAAVADLPAGGINAVYAAEGEAERQTARLAARKLGVKVRTRQELHELDYGLWQGLTHEEIERRQPKVYHQWQHEPARVRPPGGETLAEAQERLREAVRRIVKQQKGRPVLLVLRPVAAGLLRCLLGREMLDGFGQRVADGPTCCRVEVDEQAIA